MLTLDAVGGHYLLGTVIAFLAVTPIGYLLHSRFTFEEPLRWASFLRFFGGVATAFPVAAVLMIILCSGLRLSVAIATPIATVVLFLWNFTAAHWAILWRGRFRHARDTSNGQSPPDALSLRAEVLAHGRDNNFNLIRMIAASSVIVSHSVPLSIGMGVHEPFHGWIAPLDLGKAAVRVFFVISGFFILKSFDKRGSLAEFAVARVARIIPALLVVTGLTTIMLSVGVSFAQNPFPNAVNGSLWTLYYEAICYAVLAVAGLCGLFRQGRFPAFLLSFAMVYAAIKIRFLPVNMAFADLGLPFVVGMTIYHFRRQVPLGWPLAFATLAIAIALPSDATWSIALGYGALWLGASAKMLRGYNRFGDYSYGTYIFAWPVQQLLALSIPGIAPATMMVLALPIVWGLGVFSWHVVERPVLEAAKRMNLTSTRRRSQDLARRARLPWMSSSKVG